jgi:hypothetical protein
MCAPLLQPNAELDVAEASLAAPATGLPAVPAVHLQRPHSVAAWMAAPLRTQAEAAADAAAAAAAQQEGERQGPQLQACIIVCACLRMHIFGREGRDWCSMSPVALRRANHLNKAPFPILLTAHPASCVRVRVPMRCRG